MAGYAPDATMRGGRSEPVSATMKHAAATKLHAKSTSAGLWGPYAQAGWKSRTGARKPITPLGYAAADTGATSTRATIPSNSGRAGG